MSNESYEKISVTALMVAYLRTFTDIPYSKELYKELENITNENKDLEFPQEINGSSRVLRLEARYKVVDKLLAESKATQMLELASGLSPRGLIMSENGVNYVEMDLPKVMAQKQKILGRIKDKLPHNLHFVSGNAIDNHAMESALDHFDPKKPIVILNEGLMNYLNFDEKKVLAQNINLQLRKFGGVWITPDIGVKNDSSQSDHFVFISKITEINLQENRFQSIDSAKKFFEDLGFDIEVHNFSEIRNELVSPQLLNVTDEGLEKFFERRAVFVMKLR